MKTPSARRVRQVVQQQGAMMENAIVPAVQQLLKDKAQQEGRIASLEAFAAKGFLERLRWLFKGQ